MIWRLGFGENLVEHGLRILDNIGKFSYEKSSDIRRFAPIQLYYMCNICTIKSTYYVRWRLTSNISGPNQREKLKYVLWLGG